MRFMVTGSSGQIGWELMRVLPKYGECIGYDHAQLDITDSGMVSKAITDVQPDIIINAAGYTKVDQAESESNLAHQVNVEGPSVLAEAARDMGAALVHFSTDYVFDGGRDHAWTSDDSTNPINTYGCTKLKGEQKILESGVSHLIFRTSWVYDLRRSNFLTSILRQAAIKLELRVVDDQFGCPTWARTVAMMTGQIISAALQGSPGRRTFGNRQGVYHLCSAERTTWFGFARQILDLAEITPQPTLYAVSSADYPTAARRPQFSELCCKKTERVFDIKLPNWKVALADAMHESRVESIHSDEKPRGHNNESDQQTA